MAPARGQTTSITDFYALNAHRILRDFIRRGWPATIKDVPEMVRPYWTFRDELNVCDDILMKEQQVIIPKSMQKEMLMRIHEGQ